MRAQQNQSQCGGLQVRGRATHTTRMCTRMCAHDVHSCACAHAHTAAVRGMFTATRTSMRATSCSSTMVPLIPASPLSSPSPSLASRCPTAALCPAPAGGMALVPLERLQDRGPGRHAAHGAQPVGGAQGRHRHELRGQSSPSPPFLRRCPVPLAIAMSFTAIPCGVSPCAPPWAIRLSRKQQISAVENQRAPRGPSLAKRSPALHACIHRYKHGSHAGVSAALVLVATKPYM